MDFPVIYQNPPPSLTPGMQAQFQANPDGSLKVAASGISVGGGVAWADKTVTSLTGTSQTLMAANAGRKGLLVKNGATSVGINILGGTAAIGGAGTMTLQPFEGVAFVGAECPIGAITVVGTAANYCSAFEAA